MMHRYYLCSGNSSYPFLPSEIPYVTSFRKPLVRRILIFNSTNRTQLGRHCKRLCAPTLPLIIYFPRTWGLAAVYAYRAYHEQSFLDSAISIWQQFTPLVVTVEDASNGSHAMRTIAFRSQCNNRTSVAINLRSIYISLVT